MFMGIGMISVPIAALTYKRINKARDELMAKEGNQLSPSELRKLGDRAPDFRYTL